MMTKQAYLKVVNRDLYVIEFNAIGGVNVYLVRRELPTFDSLSYPLDRL